MAMVENEDVDEHRDRDRFVSPGGGAAERYTLCDRSLTWKPDTAITQLPPQALEVDVPNV
jgi:hypothetical protein